MEAFSNDASHPGLQQFLKDARPQEWVQLLSWTREITFAAGDVLVSPGQTDRSMYVVLAGRLVITLGDEDNSRDVAEVGAGSIFGEQSFVDGLPRSGQVQALTDGSARVLDHEAYLELANRQPRLAQRIMTDIASTLSRRLREANRLLV